jgi:hypothetical protein
MRILVKRVALYLSMANKNLTVRFGRDEFQRFACTICGDSVVPLFSIKLWSMHLVVSFV